MNTEYIALTSVVDAQTAEERKAIHAIRYGVMNNDVLALQRALWRQANGDKARAYSIIRRVLSHYYHLPVSDLIIDIALGELNDGVEIEWES
jgi:hypothetical protein